MKLTKQTALLFLFMMSLNIVTVHAQEPAVTETQQEEAAPEVSQEYSSDLAKAVSLSNTIIGRMLEGDIATIPADIEFISSYVADSKIAEKEKTQLTTNAATMSFFFSPENGGTVTPVAFLLATNEVYKSLNDYLYAQEDQNSPAYMYQLRHLARKLQFQVLDGNWKEIEESTADDIVDLVSDIYRNLEDPTVWQEAIRPINNKLQDGVDTQDVTLVYGAGQGYLSVAPLIETATLKKVEKEEKQQAQKEKNMSFLFVGIGIILAGIVYFILRRKKRTI